MCAVEQQQLDCLPIQATDIHKATMQDPVLSQDFSYTLKVTGSAKTRHNGAFFKSFIIIYLAKCMLLPSFSLVCQQLLELQPYKVAATERSICTASIGKIYYRCLQKQL